MLAGSDTNIDEIIPIFATRGIEVAFLVPTRVGLAKSILDAHSSIRDLFRFVGFHDFGSQPQGSRYKVTRTVNLVRGSSVEPRTISLYRPDTKNGDPRLWISKLQDYARPFNLLALFFDSGGQLFVVNCSEQAIRDQLRSSRSFISSQIVLRTENDAAVELLERLRGISRLGYVDSLRSGDTGVGFTLETLLGIRANSDRSPDYRGIELKSGRRGAGRVNRSTLFSQVPDWSNSPVGSARSMLHRFGYVDKKTGRRQLYCTVSTQPNPQGLSAMVDGAEDVFQVVSTESGGVKPVLQWSLSGLMGRLREKHRETFWVKADSRSQGSVEQFHYVEVVHTVAPLSTNLPHLLESGKIRVDLVMHLKPNGAVRDHGYLFRVDREDIPLIFPLPRTYDLTVQEPA